MSIPVDKLLQPISAEQPCGPDLSYDPRYDELENLLKGKPEVEIGSVVKPAEPPDWAALKSKSVEFLGAAKHLRPAVILACAALRVEGLPGFRDGVKVLRGLLENFWGDLHPLLDPEDNHDPQQRLNILGGLTAPRNPGSDVSGWLQVVEYLHQAPFCRPRGVAPVSLETLTGADAPAPAAAEGAEAKPRLDPASLGSQIRSADPAEIAASHAAVTEALEAVEAIDSFLSSTIGAGGSISFDELTSTLKQMAKTIGSYLPGAEGGEAGASAGGAGETGGAGGGGVPISGSIRSRDDVVRMLEKICDYYRQVEPGSPVPFILRRAQKLAVMNFIDAVQELNLATPEQLKPAMGSAVPEAPPQ